MAWAKSGLNDSPWAKPAMVNALFYIVVPVLIGAAFFRLSAPMTHDWPAFTGAAYAIIQVVTGWVIKDLFCILTAKVIRPRGASLLAVLLIGSSIAHIVIFPFNIGMRTAFELALLPPEVHIAAANLQTWLGDPIGRFATAFVDGALPAIILWVAVSLIFFHILDMPRYGYTNHAARVIAMPQPINNSVLSPDAAVAPVMSGQPSFVTLLPAKLRDQDIIAVKAEEHYVRVITSAGEGLIHERFRSVISEFERFGGLKVHRSYAINPQFVANVETTDSGMEIVMNNDFRAPVSRSYVGIARKLRGGQDRN